MLIGFVVKNSMRISQTKYRVLQDFTKKMKKQQSYEIINNQLEAILQNKKHPLSLYEIYSIKTIVDFHFRQYSAIQANIANQIKIIKQQTQQRNQTRQQAKGSELGVGPQYTEAQHSNFIKSMKNSLHNLHCQLILTLSLSNHTTLKQYLKDQKTAIVPLIEDFQLNAGSEFMLRLLKSLGYTFVGNLSEAISRFLQLINSEQPHIDQIELPFVCLIVIKSFQLQKSSRKPDSTQLTDKSKDLIFKIIKKLTKNKEITVFTQQDFESIDIEYCLNAWISYRFDRPFQYSDSIVLNQFLGCVYFIAENKFTNKKHQQAMQDIQHICKNKKNNYNRLKQFIQLSILYDKGKFKQLIQKMQNTFEKQDQSTLPQWDKVTYDIYILKKKAYQRRIEQLQKQKQKATKQIQILKQKIQQLQQELVIFKTSNQLQTNPAFSWYFFPSFFRIFFSWPSLTYQNIQITTKRAATRRKSINQ